ncbi:MAG: alpha/beta hydrolase [Lachnospiraceae bacterium]|nr:alpha/beta hydrolase [Lachnospiraceae bacterium]
MAELSRRSRLARDLVAEFNKNEFLKSRFGAENKVESDIEKPYKYPEHLSTRLIHMNSGGENNPGFTMELLTWNEQPKLTDGDDVLKFGNSEKAVLHIHGGGFIAPFRKQYKTMAGLYSELGKGAAVLSVDYRVAPEHKFPAAIDDCYAAYEWLLEQGYLEENIIFAGDSAGGGLCLSLCHKLRSMWRRMPAGLVLMSPWADLTTSGPSYKENFEIDPVFGNDRAEMIFSNPYPGDADPADPLISPMFGDYTGFPPMLIQSGSDEMLLSDSQSVAAKAKSAGVPVRLSIYENMFHVFQMTALLIPESERAWAEVGRFFHEIDFA